MPQLTLTQDAYACLEIYQDVGTKKKPTYMDFKPYKPISIEENPSQLGGYVWTGGSLAI